MSETTALLPKAGPPSPDDARRTLAGRLRALLGQARAWLAAHRAPLLALGIPLVLVTAATAWNLQGWPGRVDDDEGTYVAEAWGMIYQHHLANYTYWYDHPPLGWAQLAAYIWLTDGFARYASAVAVGREFMLVLTVVSCVLLYALCRRLQFRRTAASVTVALFGLSPLAVYYHRMVSLDNVATVWLLAAMLAATSKRRDLSAAFWAGVFSTVAVLSKETTATLLPVVFWLLWRQAQPHTRKWHLSIYLVTLAMFSAFYPLYAALRGELFPGSGHVSLLWAAWWQLFGRAGSGFLLTHGTQANGLLTLWLGTDRWLLLTALLLIPAGLIIRRLRPFAFAVALQAVIALHGGYLPFFYPTVVIPFAALLIGGAGDTLWDPSSSRVVQRACRLLVAAVAVAAAVIVLPQWTRTMISQASLDGPANSVAATAWVEQHVPKAAVVVVDDYLWVDLKRAGLNPLWDQKTSSNSESQGELPDGWKSIGYVVVTGQITGTLSALPLLAQAVKHSVPVATFGSGASAVVVRKVQPGA